MKHDHNLSDPVGLKKVKQLGTQVSIIPIPKCALTQSWWSPSSFWCFNSDFIIMALMARVPFFSGKSLIGWWLNSRFCYFSMQHVDKFCTDLKSWAIRGCFPLWCRHNLSKFYSGIPIVLGLKILNLPVNVQCLMVKTIFFHSFALSSQFWWYNPNFSHLHFISQ